MYGVLGGVSTADYDTNLLCPKEVTPPNLRLQVRVILFYPSSFAVQVSQRLN